ncbi:hypothetical protein [Oribacterium sp. NK2B42]|uniref:hypothetical protein n=1 Tax=Oribacterium sp. NK2B42 TaxID=689781 RepID=UPI00040181C8|nr:hypothetical protein [Oribacterium sp. NK2B42]
MDLKSIFYFGKARAEPKDSTAGSAYWFFFGPSSAGKRVTERSSMQITAVYAYKALGGNGTGEALYKKCMELPIEPPDDQSE